MAAIVTQDAGPHAHALLPRAAVATELAVVFIGATLPTPLYTAYRHAFGFSEITLTLVYAVYVLGNMGALFLFGGLSDRIGRRAASLPAIGIAVASTLVFLFAAGTAGLYGARVLSGLATGLASGAATAWLAELQPGGRKEKAAAVAAAANFAGTALGPLLAGLLARYAPWPLRLCWIVYLVLLAAVGVAILFTPETVNRRATRAADLALHPRLGVPKGIRRAFAAPAITAFATFALIGFYAALVPGLLADALHQASPLVAGMIVFELFAVAAVAVRATGGLDSRTAMLAGLAILFPALALLVGTELARSMALLVVAAAVTGVAAALGYRGSLAIVNRIAPADRRAEVVSSYLIAVYAGNSLPVIGVGLVSAAAGAFLAHALFAALIAGLATIALVAGIRCAPAGR